MKYSKMWDMSSIALAIPSSIAVGLFFGYWLDKWLGTKPWLLIIFTLLGVASGLMTFIRQVLKYNSEDEKSAAAEEQRARAGRSGGRNGDPEG